MSPGGGGGTGGGGGRYHHLWDTPRPNHCLQVPQDSSLGGRRQLASCSPHPAECTEEVGEFDVGLDQGGIG